MYNSCVSHFSPIQPQWQLETSTGNKEITIADITIVISAVTVCSASGENGSRLSEGER